MGGQGEHLSALWVWSTDLSVVIFIRGFPDGSVVKNLHANAGDTGSIPESGSLPGEGKANPLQYSCLEKSHGQRSLAGCRLWGHKESDITEQLNMHACIFVLSTLHIY